MTLRHIAVDARPLYGNKTGVGVYTHNLLKNLSALDRDSRYTLYTTGDFNSDLLKNSNMHKSRFWFPYSNIWFQTVLPIQMKIDKIDLFHGTNFILPALSSCRSIITIHDLTSFLFPETHKRTNNWIQRLVPFSAGRCSKIIAVSENTKKDILKYLDVPEKKITVIYEGVEERFRPVTEKDALDRVKKTYGLPKRFILFVGTLEPRKNIPALIKAFHKLRIKGLDDVQLVISGNRGWGFKEILKETEGLSLTEEVHFLSYCKEEDLPSLYSLADIFIYPSLYEGFGLPPLEAMACGTPVIVSNTSSFPEVVRDGAWMVDPRDITSICDAALTLLTDEKKRKELIKLGTKRAASFSWHNAAKETLRLYNNII